ncbi:1,6-anhydro-N-acetylmuramyl-L-alanine amidase AmpD [Neptunomonas sp.]|uniref:1,6-anhydro-N-acetylmuramyl-L-alanine amidase AmpD n=1 Tax=Neptunomonas sp. TaxID=1971898 RepID=UPI0035680B9C
MLKTTYKIENGLLSNCQWCPSPNYNVRPSPDFNARTASNENSLNQDMLVAAIDLLVIHNISLPPAQFENGYIEAFFQNCLPVNAHPYFAEIVHLNVSSHLLITRSGKVIQFVNLNERAWHAGVSCFAGRVNCNDFSIGIEMEGTDDLAYTYQQYQALAAVTYAIRVAYPAISTSSIVGHSDIAPGRKTDPGELFNWPYFLQLISAADETSCDDHHSYFNDPAFNESDQNETGANHPDAKEKQV